jgi:heptosyltransferase II
MKLLIELPSWIGDSIMSTPAIENVISHYNDAKITIIGSSEAIAVIKNHPKVVNTFILDKTYKELYFALKNLGNFDVFFSFRSSLRTKIMKAFISADAKFQFNKNIYSKGHQVQRYNNFVIKCLKIKSQPGPLILHPCKQPTNGLNKIVGINPGASYGSAKRWYPEKFATVAGALSKKYDIIIFGGENEKEIANEIEKNLIKMGIKNYQNLAAKTSIPELISIISTLDLFITGDSGPMHIAATFKVSTVAIFGPTKSEETSQWSNQKCIVVKKDLECQPCMKRSCPLNHHNCMKKIDPSEVLEAIETLN